MALLAVTAAGLWWGVQRWRDTPGPVGEPTPAPSGPGWINLLDGERAARWRNVTDDKHIFEFAGGQLHIFGESFYPLRYVGYTGVIFDDFDLHLEFRLAKGANSGVFLRATPNDPVARGFEVQVLDDHGAPPNKHGSGAIYDVVTPMFNMARPHGEWNSFDITVRDRHVVIVMNGWKVIDTDFALITEPLGKFPVAYADLPLEGHLLLQDHGGEVWYRNIYIRPLSAASEDAQKKISHHLPTS
ncbi:MAG: DUF1080 domain-containing protein [Candidatus Hydrogenedentales bacterium]